MDDVCRRAATDAAKKEIARYKPFDDPVFMDLLELVVRKCQRRDKNDVNRRSENDRNAEIVSPR